MEIKCQNCGSLVVVNGIGRKSLPIRFNNVCKHLRWHSRGRRVGQPHFLNTSKEIYRLLGVRVSPGFVQLRLQREARDRGITYSELLAQITPKGKVAERLDRMKRGMQVEDAFNDKGKEVKG